MIVNVAGHRLGKLVALTRCRRPKQRVNLFGVGTQPHHGIHRAGDDAVTCTQATCVHGSNHPGVMITEQHRRAIGNQNAQPQAALGGHNRISCSDGIIRGTVDDRHRIGVHLLHPHQPLQSKDLRQTRTVSDNRLRIITDVITQVERIVRHGRHPAAAGGEDLTDGAIHFSGGGGS